MKRAPKVEKERKKMYCIDINGNYCAFEVKNFCYGTDIDYCIHINCKLQSISMDSILLLFVVLH